MNKNSLQIFDSLPKGWTLTTLGEVLPINYGKGLTEANRDITGKCPVYGSSGKVGQHSKALTSKPTLVVGRKGSVGQVYFSPEPCWPIDTTYYAEEREDIDLRFFEHLLVGLKLGQLDKSTAVPGLSRDDYNAVEVAVASLTEQKLIVAEIEKQFSRLDEAIAGLKRIKANLKRYKAAVLKAAVEGKLTHEWRKTHPKIETGSELLKRILAERKKKWEEKNPDKKYKEPVAPDTSKLPDLPERWVRTTMAQVCSQIVDCPHSTPKFITTGYPCIDTTNIKPGRIINDALRYVSKETLVERNRRLVPEKGDVVFAREGTVGTAVSIPDSITPCLGQRVMMMRPSTGLSSHFLQWTLNSELIRQQYQPKILGTTAPHVNVGDVVQFVMPLPSVVEQDRIVNEIDRCFSFADEIELSIDINLKRAEHLRQSILKKAFSGKFRS